MNLSDVIRLKQLSDDNGPLDLTDPPEKTDFERGIDNLNRGLVDLLPKPGSDWPLDDRAKWFRLAAGIFDLGYKADDGKDREISISFVTRGLAKGLVAPKNAAVT